MIWVLGIGTTSAGFETSADVATNQTSLGRFWVCLISGNSASTVSQLFYINTVYADGAERCDWVEYIFGEYYMSLPELGAWRLIDIFGFHAGVLSWGGVHTCLAEELSARPSTADSAQQEVQLVEDGLQSAESQTSNSHTAKWRIYTDMGRDLFSQVSAVCFLQCESWYVKYYFPNTIVWKVPVKPPIGNQFSLHWNATLGCYEVSAL